MKNKKLGLAVVLAVAITGTTPAMAYPAANAQTQLVQVPTVTSMALESTLNVATKKVNQKKTTKNNLNLRQSRSTKSKSLVVIPKNTGLTVTEVVGSWSKTTYKNKSGWVASEFLKNTPAPKPKAKTYQYTNGFTALRKTASDKSAALGHYQRRAKVEFLSKSGSWSKVKVSGKTGFIYSAHLSKTNPTVVNRWLKTKQAVHKSTDTKSATIISLPAKSKVEWLRSVGSWTAIRTSKGNGWVPTSLVSTKEIKPSAKPIPKPTPKVSYRYTTANVNVRTGAGASHKSFGILKAGEKTTFIKSSNGWSNVKTSKGTGWISNDYLTAQDQYSFVVYGTLRKGQSAYHLLKGKTAEEKKTQIPSFNMYLQPNITWLSYIIPSKTKTHTVVAERMVIKPGHYKATMKDLDRWERFDPNKPMADQNYNRKLVTDKDGHTSWAYVGSSKVASYLTKNGIRVASGDYLKRF